MNDAKDAIARAIEQLDGIDIILSGMKTEARRARFSLEEERSDRMAMKHMQALSNLALDLRCESDSMQNMFAKIPVDRKRTKRKGGK